MVMKAVYKFIRELTVGADVGILVLRSNWKRFVPASINIFLALVTWSVFLATFLLTFFILLNLYTSLGINLMENDL
jgi:hypothetical protein